MLTLIGHNLVSDLSMMVRAGYKLPNAQYFCTDTGAKWVWPDHEDYSLEHLVLRSSSMGQWRSTLGRLGFDDFEQMSDDDLAVRCGGDAEGPVRLKPIIQQALIDLRMQKIWGLAMEVLPVLAVIGGTGMAIDVPELVRRAMDLGGWHRDQGDVSEGWLGEEKQDLQRILGIKNLNSDIQLAEALFDRFSAAPLRRTTRGWSVDKQALMWVRYQARHRGNVDLATLVSRIIAYNEKDKLYTTYYKSWLESGDQRVYSFYGLGGTATGRLHSYNQNLQNVPEIARELVIPSPGYDLIAQLDFKSFELAGAAHISQDSVLTQWIKEDRDIHSIMASRVLGLPEPKTKDEYRQFKLNHPVERATGKLANFATLYLVSADALSWQVFESTNGETYLPEVETQKYIDTFFRIFCEYKERLDTGWEQHKHGEWVVSDTGRRWIFSGAESGKRKYSNYRVQSLCSDLTLLSLQALDLAIKKRKWKTRIIGTVHDSIVFETTHQELRPLMYLARRLCEHLDTSRFGFQLRVPIRIEFQAGTSWGTLKDV